MQSHYFLRERRLAAVTHATVKPAMTAVNIVAGMAVYADVASIAAKAALQVHIAIRKGHRRTLSLSNSRSRLRSPRFV